jgi:hypothetical protein
MILLANVRLQQLLHKGSVGTDFGGSAAEISTNTVSRERAKPATIASGKGWPAVS